VGAIAESGRRTRGELYLPPEAQGSVEQEERVGNPVSRAFRRLFRLPTTRIVTVERCEEKKSSESIKSFRDASEGGRRAVEITIETEAACIETQSSYLASSRL
jgi:hypothetical protein